MGVWKGFPNNPQELLAYVGLYIFAKGWIEPCNFSIPNFLPCWFVPGIWVKLKIVIVITSIQIRILNLCWQQCTNCLAKLNNILEGKFCLDENWHQCKLALHITYVKPY